MLLEVANRGSSSSVKLENQHGAGEATPDSSRSSNVTPPFCCSPLANVSYCQSHPYNFPKTKRHPSIGSHFNVALVFSSKEPFNMSVNSQQKDSGRSNVSSILATANIGLPMLLEHCSVNVSQLASSQKKNPLQLTRPTPNEPCKCGLPSYLSACSASFA